MQRADPSAGRALARARSFGVSGSRDPFLAPVRRSLPDDVRAVIVHSDWAAFTVRRELPETPVARIRLGVAGPGPVDRAQERRRLGLADDEVALMHLGFLTPQKGLDIVVGGVSAARAAGVAVRLVIVGSELGQGYLDRAVSACGPGRSPRRRPASRQSHRHRVAADRRSAQSAGGSGPRRRHPHAVGRRDVGRRRQVSGLRNTGRGRRTPSVPRAAGGGGPAPDARAVGGARSGPHPGRAGRRAR